MSPLRFSVFSRRARRPRFAGAVALAVLVSVAAACQGTKPAPPLGPPPPPKTYCASSAPDTATEYQAAFDGLRAANAGYFVASDGGIPVRLPDDRILWFFGDTVLGRWTPGNPVDPFLGLVSNSWIIQQGACFTPTLQPIPNPAPDRWVWPTGAVVDNGVLRVIGGHFRRTGPGQFGFEFVRMEVYTYSLPGLTLQGNPVPLQVPTSPGYGETVFVNGGYVYAYGRERQPDCGGSACPLPPDHHFVARVPVGELLSGNWQFWDDPTPVHGDEGFTATPVAGADPMLFDKDMDTTTDPGEGPLAGLTIAANGAGFLASSLSSDVIPGDLETWHGAAPQGPWTRDATTAFEVPDYTTEDQFAYGGRVLLAATLPGVPNPIALWSVNHESLDAVLEDPDTYKVIFDEPDPGSLTP